MLRPRTGEERAEYAAIVEDSWQDYGLGNKKFRLVIESAAPAIDFSKENPLSNELLFEWKQQ